MSVEVSRGREMAWQDSVIAAATVITAFAAIAAAYVANTGLNKTAKQLEGTTLYQIARDGKALEARYRLSKKEKSQDMSEQMDDVMSYFDSVYRLHNLGVLDDRAWRPIANALCRFVRSPDVQPWWEKQRIYYETNFRHLVQGMEGESKCPHP